LSLTNDINRKLSGTQVYRIADVLQTKNGNIYVLLNLELGSEWSTQIVKFDAQGNYIADKILPMGRYAQGLVEAENNNFIIVQDYSANNSITLLKMNPELNNL